MAGRSPLAACWTTARPISVDHFVKDHPPHIFRPAAVTIYGSRAAPNPATAEPSDHAHHVFAAASRTRPVDLRATRIQGRLHHFEPAARAAHSSRTHGCRPDPAFTWVARDGTELGPDNVGVEPTSAELHLGTIPGSRSFLGGERTNGAQLLARQRPVAIVTNGDTRRGLREMILVTEHDHHLHRRSTSSPRRRGCRRGWGRTGRKPGRTVPVPDRARLRRAGQRTR